MKILQLIHKVQARGAEIFTSQLSNHLVEMGHEVRVVSIFMGEGELPYRGEIFCLGASQNNRFMDWNAWKTLASVILDFQPDVVQTNAGDTLKYAVLSKKIFRWQAPIIVRNASEVGRYLSSIPQKLLNTYLYKNVHQVISVSRASERDILKLFPFLKGKTGVIPVGLERSLKGDDEFPLMPESVKHIIHVGGFSFEKNHEGLLRIFNALIKSVPALHLHLVGDGPLRAEIQTKVNRMGLDGNVSFYGFVNNPLAYIKAADVLVLPSIIEGLPGVLLEAMYCKTPVVAYNVGGISEIVLPDTGSLIEEGDEESFISATLEALNSMNNTKVPNAYNMVCKEFMNERIAENFLKVYKKLNN